jgi:SAM-dependent methyltransferase
VDAAVYRAHAELERDHWWFVGRRAVVGDVLERHVGTRVGRILDVGCGTGGMLPLLARFGDVTALEPEPFAVDHARRQPVEAEVVLGRVPEDVPATADFDLVTAFDVIEHLEDDVGALRSMASATRPGGTVLVTVPALPWLWSEHDVANGHFRRYRRRDLARVLDEAGMDVRHLSFFNAVLFAPIAAVRLVGRLRRAERPGRSDFDMGLPPKPVNRLLAGLLGGERRLVSGRGLRLGVSLIAVARVGPS